MKLIIVLLVAACIVPALGDAKKPNRKNSGDAFCNASIPIETAISAEVKAYRKAVKYANATFYIDFKKGNKSLANIVGAQNDIFAQAAVEITAKVSSTKSMLALYLDNAQVTSAAEYNTALDSFMAVINTLIGQGAADLHIPYDAFIALYSTSPNLYTVLLGLLGNTHGIVIDDITRGTTNATLCVCKKLRRFTKLMLDLGSNDCGEVHITEMLKHAAIVNSLLISGKETVLSFLSEGMECFRNVAKKTNADTLAMMDACLGVQALGFTNYTTYYIDYANAVFSVSRIKAELITEKLLNCYASVGGEAYTAYLAFTSAYIDCVVPPTSETSAVATVNSVDSIFYPSNSQLLATLGNLFVPAN